MRAYTDVELRIWWIIAALRGISAKYEQQAQANRALARAIQNKN